MHKHLLMIGLAFTYMVIVGSRPDPIIRAEEGSAKTQAESQQRSDDAPATSTTPAKLASDLPADGIYPQGRKLAFAGYSGDPARDLANGFTLAGPVYGHQRPYLDRCFANDWPVIAHVGPHVTFRDKNPAKYKVAPDGLRRDVAEQVKELAVHKQIAWWAIRPEELRPWRGDEMPGDCRKSSCSAIVRAR